MGLLSSGWESSFTTSSYVGTSSPIPSTPWGEGRGREREGQGGRERKREEDGEQNEVNFSTESSIALCEMTHLLLGLVDNRSSFSSSWRTWASDL